jgi:hypothetical protein
MESTTDAPAAIRGDRREEIFRNNKDRKHFVDLSAETRSKTDCSRLWSSA